MTSHIVHLRCDRAHTYLFTSSYTLLHALYASWDCAANAFGRTNEYMVVYKYIYVARMTSERRFARPRRWRLVGDRTPAFDFAAAISHDDDHH